MKKRFGISVRLKIMGTIFLVSCFVLGFAGWDSVQARKPRSRGDALTQNLKRYDTYRRALGGSISGVGVYVAADPELVSAFTARDETRMQASVERAARALSATTAPDLVVFVTAGGELVRARGTTRLTPAQQRSALFGEVTSGIALDAQLAVIGEEMFQVSTAPIRDSAGAVVGGVVLGRSVDHYMSAYTAQTNPVPTKQTRLVIVNGDGNVAASSFARSAHEELSESLRPSRYKDVVVLGDNGEQVVKVIEFRNDRYEFVTQDVMGYSGDAGQKIGTLFVMRAQSELKDDLWKRIGDAALVFGLVGALALFIGYLLSIGITRPIRRYVQATEDLAQGRGDLTRRLDESSRDELGHLAVNLNAVFANIQALATKVQRAAFQVGASSAEISAASKQMLGGAREQARHTEGSTAAVTELSASIQQVAENAMEATRVAKSSGEAVQAAIERMNQIRATVEEAAARISELGESGKRIGNIVEVIRQISDQTTLLALNAAIEAAHAGEQGRGFAVVADEVSSLAKRVGQSARDIEDLIATIKEQTSEAVRTMTAGTREVEAGTTLVARTLADLQKLVQVVQDTATAVQEQAVASDEIARNMDVVQKIAQEVLSSSEEAVEQGDHLHKLAFQLEESVKGFRTESRGAQGESAGELPADTSSSRDKS